MRNVFKSFERTVFSGKNKSIEWERKKINKNSTGPSVCAHPTPNPNTEYGRLSRVSHLDGFYTSTIDSDRLKSPKCSRERDDILKSNLLRRDVFCRRKFSIRPMSEWTNNARSALFLGVFLVFVITPFFENVRCKI